MKIFDFLKNIKNRLFKDDISETDSINIKMVNSCLASAESLRNYFSSNSIKSNKIKIYNSIYLECQRNNDVKSIVMHDNKVTTNGKSNDFIIGIYESLVKVTNIASKLNSMNEEIQDDDIITVSLSAKKTNLLRATDYITFICNFTTPFINHILHLEYLEYSNEENKTPKYVIDYIDDNLINYFYCLKDFSVTPEEFEKTINDVPDVNINEKNLAILKGVNETKVDPFFNESNKSFYSPVFVMRSSLSSYQTDRYERLVLEKKKLDLQLVQLNSSKNGENNAAIESEIEKLNSKISRYAKAVSELEEDIGIKK